MKRVISVVAVLALMGCTATQKVSRPDGSTEYLVACGAGTGWNICYSKANELCPAGYNTLSEDAGFNRKELRVVCPKDGKATP